MDMDNHVKESDLNTILLSSERKQKQENSNEAGQTGTFSPFTQLPNELYWNIFEKINSSEELIKCCDVSPLWRDLILAQTPLLFFHKVIPNVLPYLARHDYFSCRQVCHDWMQIVGKQLENDSLRFDDNSWLKFDFYRYNYANDLESFWIERNVNGIPVPVVDPCVYRSVEFTVGQDPDTDEPQLVTYFEKFVNSLHTIGAHIWFLEVEICCSSVTGLNITRALRDVLNLVPNLKALLVHIPIFDEEDQDDRNAIDLFLAQNPFPNLPQLVNILKLEMIPLPIFTPLLRKYGNQLTHLSDASFSQLGQLLNRGLTIVESLIVDVYNIIDIGNMGNMLDGCGWNIKHLGVSIYQEVWIRLQDCELQNIVSFINSCQASLESFEVRINQYQKWDPERLDILRTIGLPHLKKIKLYSSVVDNFDFLINLSPLLERVELEYSYSYELGQVQMGGEANANNYGSLYESRIWRLIPTIKTIWIKDSESGSPLSTSIRHWNYSRKIWEYMQNNVALNHFRKLALTDVM